MRLRTRLGWLLGLTADAFAVVTPWAVSDRFYAYIDYTLPLWAVLPTALFVFRISLLIDFIRNCKKTIKTHMCGNDMDYRIVFLQPKPRCNNYLNKQVPFYWNI
jgi:hypothetical protein